MNKSILKKLIKYIVPVVLLVLIASYYFTLSNSKKIIENETFHALEARQEEQSNAIHNEIMKIIHTTDNFSSTVGSTYEHLNIKVYNEIITTMLNHDPRISSMGVWFEPYVLDENKAYNSSYIEIIDGTINNTEYYNTEEFDYLNSELYNRSKEKNSSFFTAPNYNDLTDSYTITYVVPINNNKDEFVGCITTAFSIEELNSLVNEYNEDGVEFFIIDNSGEYIAHSDENLVKSHANILDSLDYTFEEVQEMLSDKSGSFTYNNDGENYYIYYDTVHEFGWKLIYTIPANYINQPLIQLTIVNLMALVLTLVIIITLIMYISSKFVHKPLHLLLEEFNNISNNKYDSDIPTQLLQTDTEFSDIGNALLKMKSNLTEYQSTLKANNTLLVENEKALNETVNYVNSIISALPIMMFVFDRDGNVKELYGMTPFSNRPKNFYKGKHYVELLGEDGNKCLGLNEFLSVLKTIDYSDGVIHKDISPFINGNQEYFEHNVTLCQDDVIISLCRRTTDTVNHIKDIKYLSSYDELTGLYNTRHFNDMIKSCVENKKLPVSIIVCDINGLKEINDIHGYNVGDTLLVEFAELLNNISSENKTVSRIAGDEFAIILPNTSTAEAEIIIEKINSNCLLGKIVDISFSISYGVDTATSESDSLLHLIKSAEELMYKQKVYTSSGRKDNTIELINSTLHAKNKREQLHSNRVSELCAEMAIALGWPKLEQDKIRTAGLLHDIGKIGISEAILNKPSRLSDEEYAEMCTHPEIGHRILQSSSNMKELSEYAYSHHEKWDGTGYPRKLKGHDIVIEARIIAIADTYDAITSSRSYREGLPKEFAISELIKHKNTQFDPELVDIFIEKVLHERLEDYQS